MNTEAENYLSRLNKTERQTVRNSCHVYARKLWEDIHNRLGRYFKLLKPLAKVDPVNMWLPENANIDDLFNAMRLPRNEREIVQNQWTEIIENEQLKVPQKEGGFFIDIEEYWDNIFDTFDIPELKSKKNIQRLTTTQPIAGTITVLIRIIMQNLM